MRFHLIDRIEACEPGREIRALKLTSRNEEFWRPWADGERMPEPLILEALCQAGTWLVLVTTQRRKRAALLSIGSARFAGSVAPGDVLELAVRIESMTDEAMLVAGEVTVDGERVLEARDLMCALIDAGELDDPDAMARMQGQLLGTEAA